MALTSEAHWSQAMRSLWLSCLLWESLLPSLEAHPLGPTLPLGTNESPRHWELHWLKYTIGLIGITVTAFTLVGCLCCRRNRRPKGFQEFKDGSSIENDVSVPQLQGLELQVPVSVSLNDRVQFEPLPVERFVPEICVSPRPKPPPPSPSLFDEESESDRSTLRDSCHEWFQKTDLHVPREKLKYLREMGHGWFGKVVEGCADLQGTNLGKTNVKNSNVVVRILTEEATAKEKAWFLGEATPYFKLRHRNILSLFGSCLETDPYLLLFESCPLGDLKGFLRSNRDAESRQALDKENMPTRIAIEVGAGLRHMHEHGLAHTDLSARNCLVASDLSIKLGDYGTGVEKYPGDYYVLGDRALPIRWSAPESVECTETTIETREITPRANLWSYAVLLWEIAMWGERPYNDLEDEKVIEMLLSSKSGLKPVGSQLLLQNSDNCASNLLEAIKTCLVLEPEKRSPLEQVRHVLLKDQLEAETSDFEQRWETLRPNITQNQPRSASLQDLRGSLDSEQWPSLTQTSFRLGPEEPVKNAPGGLVRSRYPFRDSDSETEEESWRGRVERGAYTEKVKQKSKSVADLMVLVHIEPDSDADLSLGPQMPMAEKSLSMKKRLPARGSDSDLPSAIFDDQFDLALRKLRDPLVPGNSLRGSRITQNTNSAERPKLLTLTMDQGQTPILRLAFESKVEPVFKEESFVKSEIKTLNKEPNIQSIDIQSSENEGMKLLSRNDLNQSPIRYNEQVAASTITSNSKDVTGSQTVLAVSEGSNIASSCFSNNFQVTDLDDDEEEKDENETLKNNNHAVKAELIDVNSWNNALDTALEQKSADFNNFTTPSPIHKIESTNEEAITPSPQSRAEYSAEDAEDEYSNAEDLPGLSKRNLPIDDEDDRKRMSTPDDERSSDSGFRDKESCEEEESPLTGPLPNLVASQSNTPKSTTTHDSAEEEQLRILFELDTILDAECYGTLNDSLDPSVDKALLLQVSEGSPSNTIQRDADLEAETSETVQSSSEATGETEREIVQIDKSSSDETNLSFSAVLDSQPMDSECGPVNSTHRAALLNEDLNSSASHHAAESSSWPCLASLDNNEEEDSSTMSLRSDNSYVSFGMDEEFVAAIRNELREKLPHAQMSVVEAQEPHDEDEPSLISDVDSKNWDDEVEEELAERSGAVDISIRYNTYGTPLSPILEERESAGNSESFNNTRDDSRDASITSKGGSNSLSEDDVLLIDTQTNRATLVEGGSTHSQESQELSNHDSSEDDNRNITNMYHHQNRPLYPLDKRFGGILTGGTGAPLPSPEDEACKWQQQMSAFPMLPPQLQDNLMSTSFASEQDWDSDEEDDGEGPSESIDNEIGDEDDNDDDDDDDDEGEDAVMDEDDDDDDDDEENSSSSGEFVWQQYGAGTAHLESHETENSKKISELDEADEAEEDTGEEFETEDEVEEEFTPSAWDATLAPHRSALRSPEKALKTGDQKKSVWFKKQRYHCVYEYPKETPPIESQSPVTSAWEPTSYTDWEEMIDNIDRLNFQPMDYFETNNAKGDEEFFVSSSNRPFQFQSGDGKCVSQFFPGASSSGAASTSQEGPSQEFQSQQTEEAVSGQQQSFSDRQQLGELRHTRDRLKLNLVNPSSSSNGNNRVVQMCNPVKQGIKVSDDDDDDDDNEEEDNIDKTRLSDDRLHQDESKSDELSEKELNPQSDSYVKDARVETVPIQESPVVQQSLTPVKSSPSADEQSSSDNLESKSNRDDLDVD
ncbi:hypothetical protein TSAR_007773 [Trichomalopsis sarcophagae]|uniref:Protein kinase domain-containing protein n=1 Tax=Trichomalopsis sarcophagae TaxID=543379 RepID=A0A232F0T8_9HYME|nr:hypothetical protein TSAR_007773 [Trichomalopsis sarcophagae]